MWRRQSDDMNVVFVLVLFIKMLTYSHSQHHSGVCSSTFVVSCHTPRGSIRNGEGRHFTHRIRFIHHQPKQEDSPIDWTVLPVDGGANPNNFHRSRITNSPPAKCRLSVLIIVTATGTRAAVITSAISITHNIYRYVCAVRQVRVNEECVLHHCVRRFLHLYRGDGKNTRMPWQGRARAVELSDCNNVCAVCQVAV